MLLNFSTRVGGITNRVQLPVTSNQLLREIWAEIAARFDIDPQNLAKMTIRCNMLTANDHDRTIEEIVKEYGNRFGIINMSRSNAEHERDRVEKLEELAQFKKMPQMAKVLGLTEEEYLVRLNKLTDALRDERKKKKESN